MESFIEQVCLCLFTRNLTIPEDLLHRIINWQVLSYRQVKTRRDLSLRLTRNNETQYFLLYKSFSNFKAFDITLSNSILSSTILNFKYKDFPNFGIWTKINAPFICLEPWVGYSDVLNTTGNILEKEGIQLLESNSSKEFNFNIEIL